MNSTGAIIAILGLFVLLGGFGMDTTETATSCVEYESNYGNGYTCAETEYNDPFPKLAAVTLGFAMLIGGLVIAGSQSEGSRSSSSSDIGFDEGESSTSNTGGQFSHLVPDDASDDQKTSTDEGSFASQLQKTASEESTPDLANEEDVNVDQNVGNQNVFWCPNCGQANDKSRSVCISCKHSL